MLLKLYACLKIHWICCQICYKDCITHVNTLLGGDLALVLILKKVYKMLQLWLFLQVVSFYWFCGYQFFWHLGLTYQKPWKFSWRNMWYVFEMNDTGVMCVRESLLIFLLTLFLGFSSIRVIFSILASDILDDEQCYLEGEQCHFTCIFIR